MNGLFGDMFDLNHDGKLDSMEKAVDFAAFATMMDDDDEDDDEVLGMAGLDATELEFMDEDERNEALEDAGLDLDDFDFM